jgi:hypothetical protein
MLFKGRARWQPSLPAQLLSVEDAVELLVAASHRLPPLEVGGPVGAQAAMIFALAKMAEAFAWLWAFELPESEVHQGPANPWDHLGETLIDVGGAALRFARELSAGTQAEDPRGSERHAMGVVLARAGLPWGPGERLSFSLAVWSKLLCDRLLDVDARLAANELTDAIELLAAIAAQCAHAVRWIGPRTLVWPITPDWE